MPTTLQHWLTHPGAGVANMEYVSPRRKPRPQLHHATTARASRLDDQAARMVKYLLLMAVRLACFGLLFVTPSPWRWFFAAGAIVLPYIAVLVANAVSRRSGQGPKKVPDHPPPAVEAPATTDPVVIPGEVVPQTDPNPQWPTPGDDPGTNTDAHPGATPVR